MYVQAIPARITLYYRHLLPAFKEEVCGQFVYYIEQMAAAASNRKDYQQVCGVIRELKTGVDKGAAAAIRQKLYVQYAGRPAFRDELSKV